MASKTFNTRIKLRSDIEATWISSNPILLKGERIVVTCTDGQKAFNRFDQGAVTANTVLNSNTGLTVSNYSYKTSDYIVVSANVKYYLNVYKNTTTTYGLAFYNDSKQFISGLQYAGISTPYYFKTPTNTKYIRFCFQNSVSISTVILHPSPVTRYKTGDGINGFVNLPYEDEVLTSDVGKTGKYNDLSGVPTKLSQFENDCSFVTAAGNAGLPYNERINLTLTQLNTVRKNVGYITVTNVRGPSSTEWEYGTSFPGYPYKGSVYVDSCITNDWTVDVRLEPQIAESGMVCPYCDVSDGSVVFYVNDDFMDTTAIDNMNVPLMTFTRAR